MLFDDSYNIPANASQGIYKAKGSKFIAYAFPVFSEDEIKKHLEKVRKRICCKTPLLCIHLAS